MYYNYTSLLGWRVQFSQGKFFAHTGQEILVIPTGCSFLPFLLVVLLFSFPLLICFKLFPILLDCMNDHPPLFSFTSPHVSLDALHFYS